MRWINATQASSIVLGTLRVFVVTAAAGGVWGCGQEPRQRPPYAGLDCKGRKCSQVGGAPAGGVAPGTDPGQTNDATSDSSETSDTDAGLAVALDPQEASDLQRTTGAAIGRPYALYRWSNLGQPVLRSTGLDVESLTVDDRGEWLLVSLEEPGQAPDPTWLATLSWQEPSIDPVTIPVFRTQFWSDLAAGLALSPTTIDPEASQVLLQVVDSAGQPVLGVSAQSVLGAIAYGNGGSASDVLGETNDSGTIVWINAPAGDGTTLLLEVGTDSWSVALPTRRSSVTVAAVQRPRP